MMQERYAQAEIDSIRSKIVAAIDLGLITSVPQMETLLRQAVSERVDHYMQRGGMSTLMSILAVADSDGALRSLHEDGTECTGVGAVREFSIRAIMASVERGPYLHPWRVNRKLEGVTA